MPYALHSALEAICGLHIPVKRFESVTAIITYYYRASIHLLSLCLYHALTLT